MTKADIVDQISERTGLTKKDVAETVDCFLNAVAKALSDGHHIEIRGFGTFRVKDRKSRIARNPRTGEAVPVPPRRARWATAQRCATRCARSSASIPGTTSCRP